MQKKTIQRVVKKKMKDWLDTITDKKLREKVKANILVSGGAIASMFLKEQVNDFDVYIQDMDVLRDLAEYYCQGEVLDGRLRLEYIKDRYPDFDPENPVFKDSDEEYVAEHFVRIDNLKPDQIKLDINGAGRRITPPKAKEGEEAPKYQPVFLSQNAISLSDDVQIVLRFSGNAEQIHKTFDFIHATNYFTFKDGLVTNIEALESLLTTNLKYQGSLYPLTSIIRMKKFIKRHWMINAGEILKIMFQISELNLRDIKVLEEQLIGVDVAYFSSLIELLRGVDPKKINAEFLSEKIDEVFNAFDKDGAE